SLLIRNHISTARLKFLTILRKIIRQFIHINFVLEEVVQKDSVDALIFFTSKNNVFLIRFFSFCERTFKNFFLMSKKYFFFFQCGTNRSQPHLDRKSTRL